MKNHVYIGMSGGVDSSAAAYLLKKQGYDVTGFTFKLWEKEDDTDINDAKAVCEKLEIPHITVDLKEKFKETVLKNFYDEYQAGRTPNPCVMCNPNVKFKRLIHHADEIGAYYIATGHYCRIFHDENDGKFYIQRAVSEKKDQSYMLYRLRQDVLSRLIFPLGEFLSKDETRELARENSLQNAEKKDSQEICFIDPTDNYAEYIKRAGFTSRPGEFVDKNGNILGIHQGILNYTLGQRKGLGIALGKPAFVTKIDFEKNRITLGDNEDLFHTTVISQQNVFAAHSPEIYDGKEVLAKVRYSAAPAEAVLKIDADRIITEFKQPQRAATPGQSIVFYDGDRVLGGGFISE